MMVWIVSVVAGTGLWMPAARADGDVRRDAVVEAVERTLPAVGNIGTETVVYYRDPFEELLQRFWGPHHRRSRPNAETRYSLGSGVMIHQDGYMLTNDHVVRRATRIWVTLAGQKEPLEAELVASDERNDVALIRIKSAEGRTFPTVPFEDEGDLLLGETVLALGNPFGLGGSVSKGILSSKTRRALREESGLDVADWLQTDAAVNPGNSGGPLINLEGRLIGLNVAIHREGEGISFAVPIERINEALADMLAPERLAGVWFGARVDPSNAPFRVIDVEQGSPAAEAGLESGDELATVQGKSFPHYIDLMIHLSKLSPGERAKIGFVRDGQSREATIRARSESERFDDAFFQRRLGVSLQPLGPDLAGEFGFHRNTKGLLVSGVVRGSDADRIGIESGMLVEAINGLPATGLIEAGRVVRSVHVGGEVRLRILIPTRLGGRFYVQAREIALTVR